MTDDDPRPPSGAPLGARLAREALRAPSLTASDGIRPEAVARGRALFESGRLGADTDALAEAILERLEARDREEDG